MSVALTEDSGKIIHCPKKNIRLFHRSEAGLESQLLTTETLGIIYLPLIWKGFCRCNLGRKASNKLCRKPDLNKNRLLIFLIQERILLVVV